MSNITELLTWDTEVFGYKIARILPARLDKALLKATLAGLKSQGIGLVYWASDSTDEASCEAAQSEKGFLADKKVTYLADLQKLPLSSTERVAIESYPHQQPNADLEGLALQSGLYSRFRADPRILPAQFEKVYKLWIANSTNKKIAQQVLVIREEEKIAGMITLGEKNHRGDIGLLAVSEQCRGKGYGKALVQAAQRTFAEQGYQQTQVVTQGDNLPACKLYEACGYAVEKIENFYHFWL